MPENNYQIEKDKDGYRVKTGPLDWTEAHAERARMIRARKLEQQNKELLQGVVLAAIIVFIACAIAGYVIAVYVL